MATSSDTIRGETKDGEKVESAVDRISKLPEPILHQILSYVSTVDVVRMSILSRYWRRVWLSVPSLKFSELDRSSNFVAVVENCLKHRRKAVRYIADSVVTSFKLQSYSLYPENFRDCLLTWFKSSTIQNNVKNLDLYFPTAPDEFDHFGWLPDPFEVPSTVMNGRSLTHLSLVGHISISPSPINLPSLNSMYLECVAIDDETLKNLFLRCPSLEEFELNGVESTHLQISSPSLKSLIIGNECESIEIEAKNLQVLSLTCTSSTIYDFSTCVAIKVLSLFSIRNIGGQTLEAMISKLPLLEDLTLGISGKPTLGKYEVMTVSSPSLKHVWLIKWNGDGFGLKVMFETPNLVSFTYEGDTKFIASMEPVNRRLDGCFYMVKSFEPKWFSKLITFFSGTNLPWNNVSLYVHKDKELIIPNVKRKFQPPWTNVKHLKVKVVDELTRETDLRNSLQLLISPSLESLSIEKVEKPFWDVHIF